jgi:hypothetical protein
MVGRMVEKLVAKQAVLRDAKSVEPLVDTTVEMTVARSAELSVGL